MSRPQSKFVRVNPNYPEGAGQCDRCGHWYNLRDLVYQMEWAGTHLYNTRILVCTTGNMCYDKPQEQFRTIILPPDPPALLNARIPDFAYEEQTARITQYGDEFGPPWAAGPAMIRATETGEQVRIIQYLNAPYPVLPPGANLFILGQSELGDGDVLG